jgi:ArsR family transcriptional regulator
MPERMIDADAAAFLDRVAGAPPIHAGTPEQARAAYLASAAALAGPGEPVERSGRWPAAADPWQHRWASAGGEACVCDLTGAFELSQPTVSHHLKVPHEAGLLEREKRGVWAYSRVRTDAMQALARLVGPADGRSGAARTSRNEPNEPERTNAG